MIYVASYVLAFVLSFIHSTVKCNVSNYILLLNIFKYNVVLHV